MKQRTPFTLRPPTTTQLSNMTITNIRDPRQLAICATSDAVLTSFEHLKDLSPSLRLRIEEAVETALEVAYRRRRAEARQRGGVLIFPRMDGLVGRTRSRAINGTPRYQRVSDLDLAVNPTARVIRGCVYLAYFRKEQA